MLRTRRLLLVFALVFIALFLLRAPAAHLYGWLAPSPEEDATVQLLGISGTILEGDAAGVLINDRTVAHDLHWRVRPLSWLSGRVSAELSSSGAVTTQGRVSWSPSGALRLDDTRLGADIGTLAAVLGQPFLPIAGQLALTLERAMLVDTLPVEAEGRLMLGQLRWTLASTQIALGDFSAVLRTEDERIVADIGALDGPLDVNGSGELRKDGSYLLQLNVKAKPDADPAIADLLQALGRADAQGYRQLRKAGRLTPATGTQLPARQAAEEEEEE